ncbi:hypothetical protein ACFWUP_05190 [Nocardia sp. NPDC058658]|uniref:hypothetical protein n=1 Tax=Nocardia sp. NPDC058658 TaxID=3346580 RepID=UPI003669E24E
MRTHFDPDEADEFEAATQLIIRRCVAWADEQGYAVDPFAVETALGFRHHSIDGRLAFWTGALAKEFLLSFLPRSVSVSASDATVFPDSLRALIGFLHASGLADPTGDSLAEVDGAITQSTPEFAAAMTDQRNFGLSKFWVMTAIGRGIDPTDGPAMNTFFHAAQTGRVEVERELLDHIVARHLLDGGGRVERAVSQLPVVLPAEAVSAETAEHTHLIAQLRELVDWVGEGRALTTTGAIKLADARHLVTVLETGDICDPTIGGRVFRTKSSTELFGLVRLVELAKKIRVVRVVKNRLVRVAKAAPLLRDPLALWTAAFDAQPALGLLTPPSTWFGEHTRMLASIIDDVLPDVFNTLYGLPEPMPVVRLNESVWAACAAEYYLDSLEPATEEQLRTGVYADLARLLDHLADIGAVELTVGDPDPLFRSDLDEAIDAAAQAQLPPDVLDRLRVALAPDAGPIELISLTPLATRAVRARLIDEGRNAPLVGELVDAPPAQLLGMLAEHYSQPTAEAEIAGWLAAHGGHTAAMPLLIDAVRTCPFRARASAMLSVLTTTMADPDAFLQGLRSDPALGPIVVQQLVSDGTVAMADLDPTEGVLGLAEQLIQLCESQGAGAVTTMLSELPAPQAREMLAELNACGHPDTAGLADLLAVADTYLTQRRPGHAEVVSLRQKSRSGRAKSTRKRRR